MLIHLCKPSEREKREEREREGGRDRGREGGRQAGREGLRESEREGGGARPTPNFVHTCKHTHTNTVRHLKQERTYKCAAT